MIDTAVILAAGRGSRLAPSGTSESYSKPLIRMAGSSLLERTIASCRSAGIERILVVTGFRAELVAAEAERVAGDVVETVFNSDWQGANGLSLLACREYVSASFALLMSDHVFDSSILADLRALELPAESVTLAVDRKIDSIVDLDDATKVYIEDERIVSISKVLPRYNAIDTGLFACTPSIFDELAAVREQTGDCGLSQGMERLAARAALLPFDIGARWWQDVDTPEMLEAALATLSDKQA